MARIMDWSVRTKLLAAFALVAAITLAVGYVGVTTSQQIVERDREMYEDKTAPLSNIADAREAFHKTRHQLLVLVLAKTPEDRQAPIDAIARNIQAYEAAMAEFGKTMDSETGQKLFNAYKEEYAVYAPLREQFIRLVKAGKSDEAFALMKREGNAAVKKLDERLLSFQDRKNKGAKELHEETEVMAQRADMIMMVSIGIGVVLAIGLGLILTRAIARPVNQVIDAANAVVRANRELTEAATHIAAGTTTIHLGESATRIGLARKDEIGKLGEVVDELVDSQQALRTSFTAIAGTLTDLVTEANGLSKAAVEGKLATRGNADKFKGGYREIVKGVNDTLDSVIGPLNVAAEYVDRISKGDIPTRITDSYNGDFNEIKNNLNQAIEAVSALVADANLLSRAAVEGKLATRADATKHQGDFRKIVQGVNDTLDAVIGPLNVAAEYVDRISKGDIPAKITDSYNGDFNEIKNNLNRAVEAVNALVADAKMLSQAAVDGKLATRADASKHQGDFRKIVEGVNSTLDAVIGPLNVAAEYVDRISKGDIPAKISDSYNGDFNEIKNNLNRAIEAVIALVADANMLAAAAVDGRLKTRADASKHEGDFRKIVQGVNDTLDAVIKPVQEGSSTLAVMATGDLTVRMQGDYRGDLQLIKESINKVGGSLEDALRKVSEAVSATATASTQISSSTEEMAAGAHEQTSQAGEVASAVEEMTKTILENSKNASVAAETAKQARVSAEQGGQVVGETVDGMRRIAGVVNKSAETVKELGRSSDQIGEIIGVIDDIADQTNLLALNAAIEAARAGEQGRGFAVVADEVRKLAERTTKATKEIAGMIKKIQSDTTGAVQSMEEGTSEVERGIALADRAGSSLKEIVGVSQKVTDMVTQIAAASEEQSSASEQISKNVESISKVTGETAQGTQQIARAAEGLNQLTNTLQDLIGQFKVSRTNDRGSRDERHSGVSVKQDGALVAR